MLYRQIVGFSCLLKRQQSQQANWTRGGWKQMISVSDQDEEMLILPGHLCSWANSLWKSCGHTLLSWWRSGRRYLGPATSVGLCIHGEPFRDFMLQECKSFGSTSSSMKNLGSRGWSNTVELNDFLHLVEVEKQNGRSLGCVNPHHSLCHALLSHTCWRTLQLCLASMEGRSVLCIVSCQVEEPQLMGLHVALCMHFVPLFPCTATPSLSTASGDPRGKHGYCWTVSQVTSGCGHSTSLHWPAGGHHLPVEPAEQSSANP